MHEPDHASVVPLALYLRDNMAEASEIEALAQNARNYLSSYSWAGEIKEEYAGAVFPGIVGIFLFRIDPARPDVDRWIWVLVGDLPPAYLTCDECKNPWEALDGYIGAMQAWVEAAKAGRPTKGLIPVNVEASPESAEALNTRLLFLDERIMPILKGRVQQ
jgi:hypothetical protein